MKILDDGKLEQLSAYYSEEELKNILAQIDYFETFLDVNKNFYQYSLDFRNCCDKILSDIIAGKLLSKEKILN